MAKKCSNCGRKIKPWYTLCYNCHTEKKEDIGVIPSIFLFVWLPCIPTLLVIAFGKAFLNMGMSNFLLGLFWVASTIILLAIKIRDIENIKKQIKNNNWF